MAPSPATGLDDFPGCADTVSTLSCQACPGQPSCRFTALSTAEPQARRTLQNMHTAGHPSPPWCRRVRGSGPAVPLGPTASSNYKQPAEAPPAVASDAHVAAAARLWGGVAAWLPASSAWPCEVAALQASADRLRGPLADQQQVGCLACWLCCSASAQRSASPEGYRLRPRLCRCLASPRFPGSGGVRQNVPCACCCRPGLRPAWWCSAHRWRLPW
jgi:hypothetical protein